MDNHIHWLVFLLAISIIRCFLSSLLQPRHFFALLALTYTLCSALVHINNSFVSVSILTNYEATMSALILIVMVAVGVCAPKPFFRYVGMALSAWALASFSFGIPGPISNPSFLGVTLALFLPFGGTIYEKLLLSTAVLVQGQSIGYGLTLLFWVFELSSVGFGLWISGLFLLAGSVLAYLFVPDLLNDSNRFDWYKVVYDYWRGSCSTLFGCGQGTYLSFAANAAEEGLSPQGRVFFWAHSDYLECLYSLGLTGLFLWSSAITYRLRSIGDRLPHAILFLVAMVFSYPLRYPLTAAIGAWLLFSVDKPIPSDKVGVQKGGSKWNKK